MTIVTFEDAQRVVADLEERLATAERMVESRSQELIHVHALMEQAERERDEWKAKAEQSKGEFAPCEKHGAYGCNPCRTIATLTAERDAALADLKITRHALGEAPAKAEEWEKEARRMDAEIGFGHERENALREKAEAAESKRDYWHGQWFGLSQEASQFVDLRARIEALADRFERADVKAPPWLALRALLTPPKAETALDVLSRIEKWGDTDEPMDAITEDLAKLRKLLEQA